MARPQIVWFRRDLRLADQPALVAAIAAGPVIPVYILDDACAGDRKMGGASRWWLHHSLASLAADLEGVGSQLILRRGDAVEELTKLAAETGAGAVHAIRHYEPWWRKVQGAVRQSMVLHLYDGNYLLPPGMVTSGSGAPYRIFTPFYRAMMQHMPPRDVLPRPEHIPAPDNWPETDRLADWGLLPTSPDWSLGMQEFWHIGETAAQERLAEWVDEVASYETDRNFPSIDGSSRLSPYLHFGEVSPVQVWHRLARPDGDATGWNSFARELAWRDYAQNVICQFPAYPAANFRDGMEGLWRDPRQDRGAMADLKAWQEGRTGYPIVDAGMRQLWQTGWMHNRVRMIAASFLVKHLLIDWRYGERWFWDTLVDADYANNGVNWQWSSGSGVDSNMFVRIMAPLTQSEKFDAAGYIREYVPELAALSDSQIHDPPDALRGQYPPKMIDHAAGRGRALAAWNAIKGQ